MINPLLIRVFSNVLNGKQVGDTLYGTSRQYPIAEDTVEYISRDMITGEKVVTLRFPLCPKV